MLGGRPTLTVRSYMERVASGFPDPRTAGCDDYPLCAGGRLSLTMLLAAYSRGIFPWFNEGDPVMWWSPAPRCVILPENYHLPKRAARKIRKLGFAYTLDACFSEVVRRCGDLRRESGTWITKDIEEAYGLLHRTGYAHSVEVWQDGELAGGLYGVALGRAFFGESMFHAVSEASRAGLQALVELLRLRGIELLDCQQETAHIMMQGGSLLAREDFETRLASCMAVRPESEDALTLEYRDFAGALPWRSAFVDVNLSNALDDVWPFLPWRTRYLHDGAGWRRA